MTFELAKEQGLPQGLSLLVALGLDSVRTRLLGV